MSCHRFIALFIIGCVTAFAQEPPAVAPADAPPGVPVPEEAPPGVPVPGAEALPPAGAPAGKPPAAALGETKIVEDIIEKKLNGDNLAGLYRRYTGRRVIVSTAAATAEFAFVQEASPQDPLTYAQAAELLRKAAVIEGFVFTEHPQDPNLDILTTANGGVGNRGVKLDVYNESLPLPTTDVVITYVMTLSYIKPDQAVNIFTQVVGQFGAYGSISAVPNASAVVITEKASLIKSLINLQKTIDVPGSVQATRFIPVQYADVTEIATVLTELLTAQQSAQTTAGVQRADAPPAGAPPGVNIPGQPGGSSAGEAPPVQIVPEPRTNRIFAMGRPVDLLFVEGLVREFDIPSSEKTFMRRKLRFLTVSEFLPIAGDALTRAFTGTGDGGGASSGGGSRSQSGATGSNRATQQSSGTSRSNSSGIGGSSNFGGSSGLGGNSSFGGSGRSGGGGLGGGSSLGDPSVSSAPESLLVGRTLLVADNITNSVVAQGPPSALEIIERLLDQIDVKPDQVMISTVIGQLSLNNSIETGFDYLLRSGDIVSRGGGGFGPALPILPIAPSPGTDDDGFSPGSLAGSGGLRAYGTIGDLTVFMKALQSKTDFTVLSRPSIFTSNNQKGTISSGERIAIPTGSNSFGGVGNGNVSTQIEYQDVVLKLEVIPLVNSDNEITMQIALLNDEQNGTQTIQGGAGGEDLTVPRISTREILTTATVPNNNTIVLGGLIISRDGTEKSGIPILSDIPYLGRLFSNDVDTKDRSELMVFIQPSIVNSDRTLYDVQADMDNRYKVSGDARGFADGNGVLPGVNEIPRVDKKGKSAAASPAASTQPAQSSGKKPSLRPPHRR